MPAYRHIYILYVLYIYIYIVFYIPKYFLNIRVYIYICLPLNLYIHALKRPTNRRNLRASVGGGATMSTKAWGLQFVPGLGGDLFWMVCCCSEGQGGVVVCWVRCLWRCFLRPIWSHDLYHSNVMFLAGWPRCWGYGIVVWRDHSPGSMQFLNQYWEIQNDPFPMAYHPWLVISYQHVEFINGRISHD